MTNKVYIGDKPMSEHVKLLTELYGYPEFVPHDERKTRHASRPPLITCDDPEQPRKQSLEIRRLKRERGQIEGGGGKFS